MIGSDLMYFAIMKYKLTRDSIWEMKLVFSLLLQLLKLLNTSVRDSFRLATVLATELTRVGSVSGFVVQGKLERVPD